MVSSGGASNESVIYGFLTGTEHLTAAQAAGVLGNLQVESGFSPTASNPGEGAIGIAQWEGGRRAALDRYAAAHGGKETDLAMQLGYLGQELAGGYSNVLALIRKTSDPQTVARYWDVGPGGANSGTGFENSSGEATQQRMADAQAIYQQIQTGSLTASSSPPIAGDAGSGGDAAGFASGIPGSGILKDIAGGVSEVLPWNWGKDISKAEKGVVGVVIAFVTKLAFVGLGLSLVLLGVYTAARPEPSGGAPA